MAFKRVFVPMVFLGIILTLSSTAFAQAPTVDCQLSIPGAGATGRGTANGLTEPVAAGPDGTAGLVAGGGSVKVTCTNTTAAAINSSVAVLTVSYGATITNGVTHPSPAAGIRIANQAGVLVAPAVGAPAVTNAAGQISFVLSTTGLTTGAGLVWAAGATGSFDVAGVLVSLNGITNASLSATLLVTTPGAGYSASNNVQTVIGSIAQGLTKDKTTVPSSVPQIVGNALLAGSTVGGPANFNSVGLGIKQSFVIRIEENFQDLFKFGSQFNGGGTFPSPGISSNQVEVRFTGIPAGLTLGGCGITITDSAGNATVAPFLASPVVSPTTLTQGSPNLTIAFTAAVSQVNVEVLWVACTTITAAAGTVLPSTPITAQVTLAPVGTALPGPAGTIGTSVTNGQIPRYQVGLVPAGTTAEPALVVVNFPAAAVSLLIPFATVGGGFNTGIAIANTTTDPLGSPSLATPQNGTLTFTMFDNSGTVKSYSTVAASPGSGLSGGVLNSGKVYVVNLSELLTAATAGSTFNGYIFVQTNFTNAHGSSFVYNGAGFTSASPVLVVGAARPPQESLGQ